MLQTMFRYRFVLVFGFVFFVGWLVLLVHPTGPVDDGQFYIKQAYLFARDGWFKNLPWLYYTAFRDNSPGLHFLFPLLLSPLASLLPLAEAALVAGAAGFAGVMTLMLWLLEKLGVRWPVFWLALLMFGSGDFLFRLLLTRPIAWSLAVVLLEFYLIIQKRYGWLAFLGLLYVWLYDGYIIFLLWPTVILLVDLATKKKLHVQPLLWAILGLAVGLVLNPYFPQNVLFHHFSVTPPFWSDTVQNSREWEPYQWYLFFKVNWLVIAVFLVGAVSLGRQNWDRQTAASISHRRFYVFFGSLILLLLTLTTRRFIEYAAPLVMLFGASEFGVYLARVNWFDLKTTVFRLWQFRVATAIFVAVLVGAAYGSIALARGYFRGLPSNKLYQEAAQWLQDNSQPGDIVFNAQWDQFPQLFYLNDYNYYVTGLDPMFLYKYDRTLYADWRLLSEDRGDEATAYYIVKDRFHAQYVFLESSRNPRLARLIDNNLSDRWAKVYQDDAVVLYAVH